MSELLTPSRLAAARWFAGKGRELVGARLVDRLEPAGARGSVLAIAELSYADGEPEAYALPLRRDGDEAGPDDPLWPALAATIATDGSLGAFTAHPGPASSLLAVGGPGRQLTPDQTNTSVALGGTVVKLFRRLDVGLHPEPELLAALDGAGVAPRLGGWLVWHGPGGPATVAVLEELVLGPGGWEHVIERLLGMCSGEAEPLDAAPFGTAAAVLHTTVAARLGTSRAEAPELEARRGAAGERLELLRTLLDTPERDRLDAARTALLDALDGYRAAVGTTLTRVHGDLNVGQFVIAAGGPIALDFEGEPGRPLAERRAPWTPAWDLACLLLSFDNTAAAARRRARGAALDTAALDAWPDLARDEALRAYAARAPELAPTETLRRAAEAEKQIAELHYAATTLPEWLYAPLETLRHRFGAGT